jgi:hypothetical protein
MKLILGFALLATLGLVASNASAQERACRPSLSNFYHCPDTSKPSTNNHRATGPAVTAKPTRRCTPSLSNGYSCAPTSKSANRAPVPNGAYINIRPKVAPGFVAQQARLCGPTLARTFITSRPHVTTATLNAEATCASRMRLVRECAPRKMRRIPSRVDRLRCCRRERCARKVHVQVSEMN